MIKSSHNFSEDFTHWVFEPRLAPATGKFGLRGLEASRSLWPSHDPGLLPIPFFYVLSMMDPW